MLTIAMTVSPGQSGRQDGMIEASIAKIAAGDKNALAFLYEKTHAAVYGFALSMVRNRPDAEDILHDAYLQIWKSAGSYRPAGKPLAWIFTITRNLARMRLREGARTVDVSPEDWQEIFADQPAVDPAATAFLRTLPPRPLIR